MPVFHRNILLVAILIYFFLINVDYSVVNLALPSIGKDLHATATQLNWMMNAFFLVAACLFVVGGKLSDIFGYKKMFLAGMVIFIVASVACAMAQAGWQVIIGRGLQGLTLILAFTASIFLAQSIFPETQRGRVMGYIMGTVGFAQAVGPALGGFIVHYLNWRWIFLVNIPFSFFSFLVVLALYQLKLTPQKTTLDIVGVILFSSSLLLITVGISHQQGVELFVGLIMLVIFTFSERYKTYPLIHADLLRNRNYLLLNIIRIAVQWIFFTYVFMLSLYLKNILGYSVLVVSYILLSISLAQGFAGLLGGKFTERYGYKMTTTVATALMMLSCILLLFFSQNLLGIVLPSFLLSLGAGLYFTCSIVGIVQNVASDKKGAATGLFYSNAFTATTLGIASFNLVMSFLTQHFLRHISFSGSNELAFKVKQVLLGGASLPQNMTILNQYHEGFAGMLLQQFHKGFLVMLAVFIAWSMVSFISALLLRR